MVLNKKYNVSFSRETVEKVEAAAKELGYAIPKRRPRKRFPDREAHRGFLSHFDESLLCDAAAGHRRAGPGKGGTVYLCAIPRDLKREGQYLKMMDTMHPMGIIYTCNPSPSFKEQIKDLADRTPLVIINNRENISEVDAVQLNNAKPGRLMAEHLLSLGHRDVAFISPAYPQTAAAV